MIKERIPLQIVDNRLILTTVVECAKFRVRKQIVKFVIDTGSPNSYLSDREVTKFQIPLMNRSTESVVGIGGSKFKQTNLPKFKIYVLKEDDSKDDFKTFDVNFSALKTTKTTDLKKQDAQLLPSILGMNFLRGHQVSLHVLLSEELAYLQIE